MLTKMKQPVTISPLAGKPVPKEMLVDLARLERDYYVRRPDVGNRDQMVSFGTAALVTAWIILEPCLTMPPRSASVPTM